MTKLSEKIKISKIVPRYSELARNVHILSKRKDYIQYKIGVTIYSENEIKRKFKESNNSKNISMWTLFEINDNNKLIYAKPYITYDNGKRFFDSDEKMDFFLEYNSDMIEFM